MNEEAPHYLLDSNIVSEIIKRDADFNVIKKLAEHSSDCAICAPVWEELMFGLKILPQGMNRKRLEDFLINDVHENFPVKNYTEKSRTYSRRASRSLKEKG